MFPVDGRCAFYLLLLLCLFTVRNPSLASSFQVLPNGGRSRVDNKDGPARKW